MKRYFPYIILALIFVGVYDAGYLTLEHYRDMIPPCGVNDIFADCGRVLRSEYAKLFGIPLALLGLIHYVTLQAVSLLTLGFQKAWSKYWLLIQTAGGLLFSLYLVFLQLVVIRAICPYCMLSAIVSTLLFILVQLHYFKERKLLFVTIFGFVYQKIIKPFFFLFDAELVHIMMVKFGEILGKTPVYQVKVRYLTTREQPMLTQQVSGITFDHPVGLSAGFDYEGWLTQTLSPWGFGWQTVGTITNGEYEGNTRPMLGRLPKSRALLVNKGFKNLGAEATIKRLGRHQFHIPVGISIGRTNSLDLKTQKDSIADIISAFTKFEQSSLPHSYYELNISCPNLKGDVEFYTPAHLEELLIEVDKLSIKRPVFVKMPIEKSDIEVEAMLAVIAKHSPKGVIFGNLQKDRKDPSFESTEIASAGKGNFSGKPTHVRSNELIRLAYKKYKERFVIVGCGGIFSAEDAYTKIKLGASLVQLITGMIFQGPQLIAQINIGLEELLKRDGYTHISEAIGTKS
jgi:dihydroorotate dehydrogenase